MSERRFVIAKMPEFCEQSELYNITESELFHRLVLITDWIGFKETTPDVIQGAIGILLHGDGKESDPYKRVFDIDASQPDPWEAWVEEMPYGHQQLGGYGIWYQEMQAWFRKMPRGK